MNHSSLNGSISSGSVGRNVSAVPRPTGTLDRDPEFFSITARNWLIHQRYVRKEFDICKLLIDEELQKTRGYNEYANYVLGLILRHEGKIQESMEYFKKCHSLNPKNIENIKQVARSLLFPGSSDLAVELGLLHLRCGDYQKAINWLGYALAHDGTSTQALLATGAIIQKHEEFDTALAKYKMAAQHRPESAALWNNVGMCFFGKKKYIAAISCLKMANYLAPLDWKTLYNLGLVHLTCRQYASSFTFLSACVKLRHRHAPSFMLLALALMHLDDPDNAGKAWEQAIKLDPDDPGIRANYAAFWVKLGVHQRALEQLNIFNRLAQQIPNIDTEILELVRTLTTEVTKDIVSHTIEDGSRGDDVVNTQESLEESDERPLDRDEV